MVGAGPYSPYCLEGTFCGVGLQFLRSSKKGATQKSPQAHILVRSLLRRMSHTGGAPGHLRL